MKKLILLIALGFFISLTAKAAQAEEPLSTEEIVKKANLMAYYQGDDGRAQVHMVIRDKQNRTRKRDFIILRKDKEDGGDQYFYVYFRRPSDVRKMVFMVWKHPGRDDDRWLYLPALDLVKRIAASDKRSSFVGSDFFYEDVSGRSIEEDEHQLVETTDKYYVINNVPKDPDSVEFSSYKIWIDKKTFLPMKAEYINKAGKKYRIIEALEVKKIQDYPTVIHSRVKNLETGSQTELFFSDIKYNIGLKERIFTERYLRRPPREITRR